MPTLVPRHLLPPGRGHWRPQLLPLLLPLLLGVLAASSPGLARAADQHAHQHGVVQLQLVVEPGQVSLALDAPQDNLVGHERRPRNAAEQQVADAALARLRAGATLWPLPADWRCTLAQAEVDAPLLGRGTTGTSGEAADGHADVEARWRFDCARTGALRQLDLGALLDAFARIQRVDAQVITDQGQFKASARRPARQLVWGR